MKITAVLGFIISIFIGFFAIPTGAYAQQTDFLVSRVSHPQILKRNIASVTQDKYGFIWIGTDSGILRFDGRSVSTVNTGTIDDRGNINNLVTSLFSSGDYLYATLRRGGLARVNISTLRLEYINPPGIDPEEIVWLDFRYIERKDSQTLLIGSFSGSTLYTFDETTGEFEQYPLIDEPLFSEYAIHTIYQTRSGDIWLGTDLAGIIVLDSNFQIKAHHTSEYQNPNRLHFNSIRAITEDHHGNVWVATYAGGLNIYDPVSGNFSRPTSMYHQAETRFGNTYDVLIDNSNRAWITSDDGIVVLDVETREILSVLNQETNNIRSLDNNQARALFQDNNGLIWAGNEHGGLHTIVTNNFFSHVHPFESGYSGNLPPIVRSVFQYDENTVWIGIQGGGIRVLDLNTLRVTGSFVHNPSDPHSLSNNGVTSFFKDPNGGIWIGTWGGGVNYYNPRNGRFSAFRHNPSNPETLSDDRVQSVKIDSKGNLWAGTENGLNVMDRSNGNFQRIYHDPNNENTLSGNSLQSLAFLEDEENQYWVGTWYGLNLYNKDSGTVKRFIPDPRDEHSLSSEHVLSLLDDQNGSIWIATFGGGLNRLNKATHEIEAFFTNDGLPSNVIFAIKQDENGFLWLSTNNGISRVNPETMNFRNFNVEDGLTSTEFWWGAAGKTTRGHIMFGSTDGLVVFKPSDFNNMSINPPVVITSLDIFSERIPIIPGQDIRLNHDQNYLQFEFASLDYLNPSRVQYAYMLEGLNSTWNYIGNRNNVSYSHLSGGNYTLHIKATNDLGEWMPNHASVNIYIRPPFWQRSWFFLLVITSTIGLIFGVYKIRTNQIEAINRKLELEVAQRTSELAAKQEELIQSYEELKSKTVILSDKNEEIQSQNEVILKNSVELEQKNRELTLINNEKNSLLGIVAHDLRSPLISTISALSLIKMQPELDKEELDQLYHAMDEYLNRQLTLISRILDIKNIESGEIEMNPRKVNLSGFASQVVDKHKTHAEKKSIRIKTVISNDSATITADPDYLEQILDNLISNAIKFSPFQKWVFIFVEVNGDKVRIGVKDEGPGISLSDQRKLFGKFQTLSAKPTGGEPSTGLGLSIVKKFVESMNARIFCESELGSGTTFWVEFDHLT